MKMKAPILLLTTFLCLASALLTAKEQLTESGELVSFVNFEQLMSANEVANFAKEHELLVLQARGKFDDQPGSLLLNKIPQYNGSLVSVLKRVGNQHAKNAMDDLVVMLEDQASKAKNNTQNVKETKKIKSKLTRYKKYKSRDLAWVEIAVVGSPEAYENIAYDSRVSKLTTLRKDGSTTLISRNGLPKDKQPWRNLNSLEKRGKIKPGTFGGKSKKHPWDELTDEEKGSS